MILPVPMRLYAPLNTLPQPFITPLPPAPEDDHLAPTASDLIAHLIQQRWDTPPPLKERPFQTHGRPADLHTDYEARIIADRARPTVIERARRGSRGWARLLSLIAPTRDDPFSIDAHLELIATSRPGNDLLDEYLGWWAANTAVALHWSGHLDATEISTVSSSRFAPPTWGRYGDTTWLLNYRDVRRLYHRIGGVATYRAAVVRDLPRGPADPVDPATVAYRSRRLSLTTRVMGSAPEATAESNLRVWLVRATPWMGPKGSHLNAMWRRGFMEAWESRRPTPWLSSNRLKAQRGKLDRCRAASLRLLDEVAPARTAA